MYLCAIIRIMIERKTIEGLALLARIKVSPEEAEALRKEIDPILEFVNQINGVAGTSEAPEAGAVRNVMREDAFPHESGIHTEALLNNAPEREGMFLKVKKILGGSDNA